MSKKTKKKKKWQKRLEKLWAQESPDRSDYPKVQ